MNTKTQENLKKLASLMWSTHGSVLLEGIENLAEIARLLNRKHNIGLHRHTITRNIKFVEQELKYLNSLTHKTETKTVEVKVETTKEIKHISVVYVDGSTETFVKQSAPQIQAPVQQKPKVQQPSNNVTSLFDFTNWKSGVVTIARGKSQFVGCNVYDKADIKRRWFTMDRFVAYLDFQISDQVLSKVNINSPVKQKDIKFIKHLLNIYK